MQIDTKAKKRIVASPGQALTKERVFRKLCEVFVYFHFKNRRVVMTINQNYLFEFLLCNYDGWYYQVWRHRNQWVLMLFVRS